MFRPIPPHRFDLRTRPTPPDVLRRFARTPRAAAVFPHLPVGGSLSLASKMTPARYQGQLGTCASFGVTALLEFFCQRDLSEAGVTHEIEIDGGDCTAGTDMGRVMSEAQTNGLVTEACWPYDGVQVCWTKPPDVSRCPRYLFNDTWLLFAVPRDHIVKAIDARTEARADVDKVEAIKEVLSRFRIPVGVSVPTFTSDEDHLDAGWGEGPGDIHMPTPDVLKAWMARAKRTMDEGEGWHCIPLCGYNDATTRFEFKNSWGGWWGRRGFGTIPYEYIRTFCSEAFAGTA